MVRIACLALIVMAALTPSIHAQEGNEPDPQSVEAARDTIRLIKADTLTDQLLSSMVQTLEPSFRQEYAQASDEQIERAVQIMTQLLEANRGPILEATADAYARNFTYEELIELNVFFASDLGQKYMHLSERISRLGVIASQQLAQSAYDEALPQIEAIMAE